NVVTIAGGRRRFCALTDNGELWCWGQIYVPVGNAIEVQNFPRPTRIAGYPLP
ncbi:MAG TPA: hypothetical protein DEB46_10360, partial [Myxococcales bacterium]|nr:hypothetical protein [Myxococcales bacterium]